MTKNELIETIRNRMGGGISKQHIGQVLEKLGDIAAEALQLEGAEIPLPGIGKLKAAVRAGRTGRNPKTGEALEIPPMNTVKLALSTEFKRALI